MAWLASLLAALAARFAEDVVVDAFGDITERIAPGPDEPTDGNESNLIMLDGTDELPLWSEPIDTLPMQSRRVVLLMTQQEWWRVACKSLDGERTADTVRRLLGFEPTE